MAMSFEFVSGSVDRRSIFKILKSSEKGRRILNSLRLPESREEMQEYKNNKAQLLTLYQTLVDIDKQRKLERTRNLKRHY